MSPKKKKSPVPVRPSPAINSDPSPPYAIARSQVEKFFLGLSPKTLANLASQKEGPRHFKVGRLVFYLFDDLKKYVTSCPIQTLDQEGGG